MFLIAQLVLGVVAWKRGWGWKGLLPVAIAFVLGFGMGFAGLDPKEYVGVFVGLDALTVVVLIFMVAKPPKKAAINSVPTPTNPTTLPPSNPTQPPQV